MDEAQTPQRRSPGAFVTTEWSLVVAASGGDTTEAREALAVLCNAYWRPVYDFLRRQGSDADGAADLTQGFFATLLEKNYVGDARRERGRFRTFLLAAVRHHVANELDRERALKRGGGRPIVSIDAPEAEEGYRQEPAHDETPERVFDRRWARTLIAAGLRRLRDEIGGTEGLRRFERLLPFLAGPAEGGYREAAEAMGMAESAVRVAVHRLRRRLRTILREEVARTVEDPAHVDDELRHLFGALGT